MVFVSLCLLLNAGFVFGSGGPVYPSSFDCPMRELALEYAQHIQPWLSMDKFQEIADALNGDPIIQKYQPPSNCTVSPNDLPFKPSNKHQKTPQYNHHNHNTRNIYTIFIDAINGIDSDNDGSIHLPFKTIQYGLQYLRKQNINKYKPKQILLKGNIHYLQNTLYFNENDSNLRISNYNGEYAIVSGGIPLTNLNWKLYKKSNDGKDIYSTRIPSDINITSITGLRVNGTRGIRARYPNANPEVFPPGFGSEINAKSWYGAYNNPEPEFVYNPTTPARDDNPEHTLLYYNIGVGGTACYNFDPPVSYWCSNTSVAGAMYVIPTGMIYNKSSLPNTPYVNPKGGIVQTWRGSGKWSTWMFEFGEYNDNTQNISFLKGGFQGARGKNSGGSFYIENVFEELDYETEWFFNESTRTLYYKNNITNQSPNNLIFEATKLKVLFNYTGESKNKPIENMTISGITFKDTAITFMDPHGVPSGGDWSLQRTGSIYIENAVNFKIFDNIFTRLDNIAISINKYNRYHQIYKNEFVWLGATGISLWGDSYSNNSSVPLGFGYDGTTGIQPRFINISYNLGHEIGIWEKQSGFVFQAKTCQNTMIGNIFYNSPRSGIDMNDGFGGGTLIKNNLIFSVCRETGAHGPINSWDRQPYLTKIRNGTAQLEKAYDNVTQNMLISNYQSNFILDNDDGSNNFMATQNVFIYGIYGTKSTHGGHDIRHYNNMYGYVNKNCLMSNYAANSEGEYAEYRDWYFNNTCILNQKAANNAKYLNWGSFACQDKENAWPVLGNNTIYTVNNDISIVGLCNLTETQFQSKYNTDTGTKIFKASDMINKQFIQQSKVLLFS